MMSLYNGAPQEIGRVSRALVFRQALVRAHAEGIMQDALKKASLEVSWVDQDGLFRLGRFGSRAVGYAFPDSDLDLVAEFTFKEDLLQSAWSQGQPVSAYSQSQVVATYYKRLLFIVARHLCEDTRVSEVDSGPIEGISTLKCVVQGSLKVDLTVCTYPADWNHGPTKTTLKMRAEFDRLSTDSQDFCRPVAAVLK